MNRNLLAIISVLLCCSRAAGAIVIDMEPHSASGPTYAQLGPSNLSPDLALALASRSTYVGMTDDGNAVLEPPPRRTLPDTMELMESNGIKPKVTTVEEGKFIRLTRLVVIFNDDGPGMAAFGTALERKSVLGMPVTTVITQHHALVLEREGGFGIDELARLKADRTIRRAEPDYQFFLAQEHPDTPNDEAYLQGRLWGLKNCHADLAWPQTKGDSVLVAVIDSGVDYTHPDLQSNMWTNPGEISGNGKDDDHNGYIDDIHGYNVTGHNGDPMDSGDHGTHCAGIIAASGGNTIGVIGVAYHARIMAVQLFQGKILVDQSYASLAIDYAVKNGARILSCSWGGFDSPELLKNAIKHARDKGVLFVAAAGNNAQNTDKKTFYPAGYDLDNIIAVGNLAENETSAADSNYGEKTVDLFAPGVGILSTIPHGNYAFKSGTSMAAPFVAGACALIWAHPAYKDQQWSQVKSLLLSHARKIDALKTKCVSGGTLDLSFLGVPAAAEHPPTSPNPPISPAMSVPSPTASPTVSATGEYSGIIKYPILGLGGETTGVALVSPHGNVIYELDFGNITLNKTKGQQLKDQKVTVKGTLTSVFSEDVGARTIIQVKQVEKSK